MRDKKITREDLGSQIVFRMLDHPALGWDDPTRPR
jgi:hypothetical protein